MKQKFDEKLFFTIAAFVAVSLWLANEFLKTTGEIIVPENVKNMSYFKKLSKEKYTTIFTLRSEMAKNGIVNPYTQAAVLSIVAKESNFVATRETGYSGTSNSRIRKIFGKYVSGLSEAKLSALKKNRTAFFNHVYGGRYGNTAPGDGDKYRGGGFNQTTFKSIYANLAARTGYDLVNHPELITKTNVASAAVVQDMLTRFASIPGSVKAIYGIKGMNDFKDQSTATMAVYHANAGWGKTQKQLLADTTGGLKKARSLQDGFLQIVTANA